MKAAAAVLGLAVVVTHHAPAMGVKLLHNAE
jgi:hypothetical protein